MHKTILIMRQEIKRMLHSTGYVIFAYVVPVAAVLIVGLIQLTHTGSSQEGSGVTENAPSDPMLMPEGFVDHSRLIRNIPDEFKYTLFAYGDEGQAKEAMEWGEITSYYVIPADYLSAGKIYYVYPDSRSYLSDGQDWIMAKTLMSNLMGSDLELLDMVWNPVRYFNETNLSLLSPAGTPPTESCTRPGASCETNDLVRYLPSIMTALFFGAFMISSSMLFNSVGKEKENRVMEVLLLSVSPGELLAGKTIGLGFAGLLQTILWLGAMYTCFNLGGTTLKLPENFAFPTDILIWGLVFFLGGYGLYASLMAGAGALVPRMKEAGVASYIAISPLFFGYAFGLMAPLASAADSDFLVFLSIFPLTSPVVMIMRLTNSNVPYWQPVLSALLLFVTAAFALRSVTAMFQTKNLLSGQAFSLRRYLMALFGR